MTVESIILVRMGGDGTDESPYGPRTADLAPYALAWEDVTGRPGTAALQEMEPRVMAIRGRMTNANALTMSTDPKLWMIMSRRYSIDAETGEETEQENNADEPYTAEERALRITQLSNFTDFDADTIAAWWTPSRTRHEVAVKLRNYLKTLEA